MTNNSSSLASSHDKSRDVTGGVNLLSKFFPIINVVMFIFGWFTVPFEVYFRKDFGERWLTVINFYAGLLVLSIFNVIQMATMTYSQVTTNYYEQPVQPDKWDSFKHFLAERNMLWFMLLYILIGSYHFFRMWWRNRTNTALHSFEDGTSRFEFLAIWPMKLINIVAIPVIRVYMLLLPKEERERNRETEIPPLLDDVTAFTNSLFEPFIILVLACFFHGIAQIWLLISAPALGIYANWKETAKLNKYLDFRDTIVEAKNVREHKKAMDGATKTGTTILKQAAETIRENPEVAASVSRQYPDLMDIIDDMNNDKK